MWKNSRPYFALQNFHGTLEFFEICRQFGHTPSKKFASPAIIYIAYTVYGLR